MGLMRSLASIQKISSINAIEGADFLELAEVLGYRSIVKKGIYEPGDSILYIEVDAFLPVSDSRFEFLR